MDSNLRRALIGMPIVLLIGLGLALAGSDGSPEVAGIPLFALCVAIAFIIQWIAYVPAYINQTEKYYDLTGSLTYVTVVLVAVLFSSDLDARSIIIAALIGMWSIRLGTFLFRRIQKSGKDGRFDEIKTSAPRFLLAWTIQGLWVSFTAAAGLAAIASESKEDFGVFAILGLLVWIIGFGIEVVADNQKSAFRAKPENKGKFINTGLWSWSRHPNYFGEIVLWVGIAIMALPTLSGWQYVTLISPVFVTLLLTKLSGVPMLEERADEKWGGQEDYEAYKANTPVLIPRPPSD